MNGNVNIDTYKSNRWKSKFSDLKKKKKNSVDRIKSKLSTLYFFKFFLNQMEKKNMQQPKMHFFLGKKELKGKFIEMNNLCKLQEKEILFLNPNPYHI